MAGATITPLAALKACASCSPTCRCSRLRKTVPKEVSRLWFPSGGSASSSSQKGTLPARVWRASLVISAREKADQQRDQQPRGLTWEWQNAQPQSNSQHLAKPVEGKKGLHRQQVKKAWCLMSTPWETAQAKTRAWCKFPDAGSEQVCTAGEEQSKGALPQQERLYSSRQGQRSPQPCKRSTGWGMDDLSGFLLVSTPGSAAGLVPKLSLSTPKFSSPTNPIYLFKIFCCG